MTGAIDKVKGLFHPDMVRQLSATKLAEIARC